jgi:hypothetical protein
VPAVRLVGDEPFHCTTCGGGVIMDELERSSTSADDVDEDDLNDPGHGAVDRRSPGGARRIRPIGSRGSASRVKPSWLDLLRIV